MAREYSVSRSPIRRVCSMLEHEGLVEIKHGIGTLVTRIEPEQLADVYAVRQILAESMGPFIDLPFADDTAGFFHECADGFLALDEGDAIGFAEINIRYYTGLTGLAGNSTLREMQRSLFFQTSRMWLLLLPAMDWAETMKAVHDELLEIIRRIEIADPVGLAYVVRNHIFESQQRMLQARQNGDVGKT
ncbi:MAG: GntR family transcriptional regulator, partial [Rhodospirillales bacterium]